MRNCLITFLCLVGSAVAQLPPPHPAFDKDAVHEIRLRFANDDWYEVLTANYSGVEADNPYFSASFEWGSYKFENVGVRFKGNSSYRVQGKKKPFRIKLNEFVKGQKIEGMASFSLSNGWNDPSFVREKPYYEMAAAMGLPAPRSNFVALYINDQYWGLYLLAEVVNRDFLESHFGKNDDGGNLYKANIGSSFNYLGEDKEAYKAGWEKQSNEEDDDWSDLIALCKLITETPAEELRSKLEPVMDVDSVLTALALDNATVNLDSYVGMGQNFNIYRRPSDGRWVWIPWDPSLAFGAMGQGVSGESMLDLSLQWIGGGGLGGGGLGGGNPGPRPPGPQNPGPQNPGPPNPDPQNPDPQNPGPMNPGGPGGAARLQSGRILATKLWAVPEYNERYRQIYKQLVDKVFRSDTTVDRMIALQNMIRPWVEQDTQKLVTMAQFENSIAATTGTTAPDPGSGRPGGGIGGAPALKSFVEGRLASVQSQLEQSVIPMMAITASETSLGFELKKGDSIGPKTVSLTLNGETIPASYSLTATTESGKWLSVTPAGSLAPGTFEVSVSGSKLDSGVYAGKIEVRSPGASNSPLTILVTLTVTE